MVEDPTRVQGEAAAGGETGEPAARSGKVESGKAAWFQVLAGILVSPRSSFIVIREDRPWIGVAMLLLVLNAAQFLAIWPRMAEAPFFEDMTDVLPGLPTLMLVVGTVFTILGLIVGWLFQALVAWLLASAFRGEASFGQSFSLAVHVSVVAWLGGLASSLLWLGSDVEEIGSPTEFADAVIVPGLNLLFPTENATLEAVLVRITPFTIWHVALLGLGAAAVFRLPERKGLTIAGIYWAAITAFMAALAGVASLVPTP